jgi:hypothetical protein
VHDSLVIIATFGGRIFHLKMLLPAARQLKILSGRTPEKGSSDEGSQQNKLIAARAGCWNTQNT